MNILYIDTPREAYTPADIEKSTLTVRELINLLEQEDPNARIITKHDGGYMFGTINCDNIHTN